MRRTVNGVSSGFVVPETFATTRAGKIGCDSSGGSRVKPMPDEGVEQFQKSVEELKARHPEWFRLGPPAPGKESPDVKQRAAGDIDDGLDAIEPNEEG